MVFITRKSLSRRTVLRGIGATVGLPFLEALAQGLVRLGTGVREARRRIRVAAARLPRECWTEQAILKEALRAAG